MARLTRPELIVSGLNTGGGSETPAVSGHNSASAPTPIPVVQRHGQRQRTAERMTDKNRLLHAELSKQFPDHGGLGGQTRQIVRIPCRISPIPGGRC